MAIEDDVLNAVLDEGTVIDGAVTLINQLITLVENNKGDPAKLTQALDAIKAKRDALAQAVAAGTAAANEGTSPTGPNQGIPAPGDGSSLGDGGTGGDTTTGTATPPPNVTTTSDVGGNP